MLRVTRRRGREVLVLDDGLGRLGAAEVAPPPEEVVESCEAFESFYAREFPLLVVLARALAGDLAAEDVAQESMLVAYHRWSQIATYPSPGGYVRGICAHKAVSAIRRTLAERRALRRYAAGRGTDQEARPPDTRFWTEVRRLPRRQAQAAALYYALDLSVADVAVTLGCAEGTVKSHLSRARHELARQLDLSEEAP